METTETTKTTKTTETTKITLRKFLEDPIKNSDECFNFFDWFCDEKSLEKRMLNLVPKLKFLVKEGILDPDKVKVNFKNNYPVHGSLYDDIRITAIDDEDKYLGGICPRTGHNKKNKCEIWVIRPRFEQLEFKNWTEFKKEVKRNKSLKEFLKLKFSV